MRDLVRAAVARLNLKYMFAQLAPLLALKEEPEILDKLKALIEIVRGDK